MTPEPETMEQAQQVLAGLDKDAQIQSLANQVGHNAAGHAVRVAQLEALLSSMDAAVAELRQMVADRDATIMKLQTEAMGSAIDALADEQGAPLD